MLLDKVQSKLIKNADSSRTTVSLSSEETRRVIVEAICAYIDARTNIQLMLCEIKQHRNVIAPKTLARTIEKTTSLDKSINVLTHLLENTNRS